MYIANSCSASIRYRVSDGVTAAIASGFLQDLIQSCHLDQSKSYLALDRSKVSRGKGGVIWTAKERGEEETDENDIQCFF